MPKLVREWGVNKEKNDGRECLTNIILSPVDEKRLISLCTAIKIGRKRKAPLRNILLHGPPGCGKSLTAKAIAQAIGNIPYAIMSGADISPLGQLGPSELRNVLAWAKNQRHGGIIIIDEAESALRSRVKSFGAPGKVKPDKGSKNTNEHLSSEAARDALNVFLSMTGSAQGGCMVILTTCNPAAIDEAVLDRCDEMIHLDAPLKHERYRMLLQDFFTRFKQQTNDAVDNHWNMLSLRRKMLAYDMNFDPIGAISRLSEDEMTRGFSGRELVKIIRAVEAEVYCTEMCSLNYLIWAKVTTRLCTTIRESHVMKKKCEFKYFEQKKII